MSDGTIPQSLRERQQWVTWRLEEDPKRQDKPKKIPCNPMTGGNAQSNNPQTWSSYIGACRANTSRNHNGIGYMFGNDDGLVGTDLDGCRNPITGEIAPWAKEALDRLKSYSEISPSGCGVKVIVRGKIAKALKRMIGDHTGVEVYAKGRFFTVTGNRLMEYPDSPQEAQSGLDWLLAQYTPVEATKPASTRPVLPKNDHAERWAEEKLCWIEDQIRHEPAGNLHNRRLELGKLAGGIIALGLTDEDEATRRILAARPPAGHEAVERKAIRDGIETGKLSPLTLPTFPTEQALIIADGLAQCPSCNTPALRSQYDYPGTSTAGWYCPRCRFPMVWPVEAWTPPVPEIYEAETATTYVIADWREGGITLAELQHKHFEPERWIVENILPEGACLLAAKYKSKKSWMALALGCAVALGGKALGRLAVSQGRVLYLDLEGKQQRIQKRTRSMLGIHHIPWPDNFHIFTEWPQGDEGLDRLVKWFTLYPDTSLVIGDVLADLRRPPDRYELPYVYDRVTVKPYNQLGEYYHAAIMLVHHFNKAKNDDIMDSISGTTGLPSAVNTMWGLARDVNDSNITVLNMRGRDLENDEPLALKWDSYLCQHVIEGPASEVATSTERRAVLEVLSDDYARKPSEIATELGKTVPAVQYLLKQLLIEGSIDKSGYGKYAIVRRATQSTYTPQTPQSTQSTQSRDNRGNSEGNSEYSEGSIFTPQSSVRHQDAVKANSEYSEGDAIRGDTSDQGSLNGSEQPTTGNNDTLQLRNTQVAIDRNGSVDTTASDQVLVNVINGPLTDAQRAELVSLKHKQKRRAAEQQADSDGWKAVEGNE